MKNLWVPAFKTKVDLKDGKVIDKCARMALYFILGRASLGERSRTWESSSLRLSSEIDRFLLYAPG